MARCDYTRRNLTGRNRRAEAERARQRQLVADAGGWYNYMKNCRLARESKHGMEARHDEATNSDEGNPGKVPVMHL